MRRVKGNVFVQGWGAAAVIAVAVLAAYANSVTGPFLFDDVGAITENPTIRRLGTAWNPPAGQGLTVDGRPVLNFSLALNCAAGGTAVAGYHALNLAIHLGAALALWSVVRSTWRRLGWEGMSVGRGLLAGDGARGESPASRLLPQCAAPVALAVALLWAVHPLQTESVTYVIQRAESLMGFFFLLTFYFFVRGVDAEREGARRAWFGAAVGAALLAAGTKEVAAALPLLVGLYDRAFVAGTFREAWRRRRGVYGGLALVWPLLAWLVFGTGSRGGTAGFGIEVTWWTYALTQPEAICQYLWLAVWPDPLVFDYGTTWVKHVADAVPYAIVLVALVTGTLIALVKKPAWGFLGMWFFCILAPTSFIPGNRQTIAEHRMYLPLAAVLVAAVGGLAWALARRMDAQRAGRVTLAVGAAAAAGLGALTVRRNADYHSELGLYHDTVAKRPDNAHARYNLGKALAEAGAPGEAIAHYEAALRLEPGWPHAHNNLGSALLALGRVAEAAAAFQRAVRIKPNYALAHGNLGVALIQLGQKDGAREAWEAAVRFQPDYAEARGNLGAVLLDTGRTKEAAEQFEKIIAVGAGTAEVHFNLGTAYLGLGRAAEAAGQFEAALRLKPDLVVTRERLEEARRRAGAR